MTGPAAERTMLADLHMHSTCSDGTLSPVQLARECACFGLRAISVTDHDTWRQNELLAGADLDPGLLVIPGIEISTGHPRSGIGYHVLGYGLCPDEAFRRMLRELNGARQIRIRGFAAALARLGIRIDADAILERATSPGKPDVARTALKEPANLSRLDRDGVTSVGSFIETYLGEGCPAHVPKLKVDTPAAVTAIRRCGGHPVWAHPALDLRSLPPDQRDEELGTTLEELQAAGLEGVETINFAHSADESAWLSEASARRGLWQTAGSDFHDFEDHNTGRLLTDCDQDVDWLV
jgi:3',5'-nucleoside bisphosphate phosphatase